MEKIKYTQKIANQDRLILKSILLIICLIGLLTIIIGVIACLGNGNYFDLIYYSVALVLILIIQFCTIFLCYELIIKFDGGVLKVAKSYGIMIKTVFESDCDKLNLEKYCVGNDYGKIIALSPNGCAESRYVLKLSGKKYLLNLDDYMYSLIEVAHDLS
ncbi:MAG: hypothetical protein K2O08_00825 [Clostridia bacterium]|nr:hypothetical protein [Clostridia bacterium]